MDTSRKAAVAREWIVFALSFGLGGHIMLALMLHAPGLWPLDEAGLYTILIGLSVYVMVQLGRSLWWVVCGKGSVWHGHRR